MEIFSKCQTTFVWQTNKLVTRQTDVSTSVIQMPATTPIIPNRREIRGWVILGKQIVQCPQHGLF